jgi:hypothetical protein
MAWQIFMVHRSGGNWTSLFCAGDRFPAPPALAFEHIFQLHNSNSYDGQFYHYLAHDPFLSRGFVNYVDAPRLRYSHILLPLLAYLVALGDDHWIDGSYFLLVLASVFLGTYWLSRHSRRVSLSGLWGLGFLLVPAVIISDDRMTIDGALAALCVAFVLFASETIDWKVYLVAMLAALMRETGVLLAIGCCIALFANRRYRAAAGFATAVAPAARLVSVRAPSHNRGTYLPVNAVVLSNRRIGGALDSPRAATVDTRAQRAGDQL